jgi:hypothetical protein
MQVAGGRDDRPRANSKSRYIETGLENGTAAPEATEVRAGRWRLVMVRSCEKGYTTPRLCGSSVQMGLRHRSRRRKEL